MAVDSPSAAAIAGRRALVCEDEALSMLQLSRALARAGLAVVGCTVNGLDGVEVALRERPDIILMDIELPGINGIEATRRICSVYRTCVIIVSGFSDEQTIQAAFDAGASGYLIKPVQIDGLIAGIAHAFLDYRDSKPSHEREAVVHAPAGESVSPWRTQSDFPKPSPIDQAVEAP